MNLEAIPELQTRFPDAVVGVRCHSENIWMCVGGVAKGAVMFEKHFTSDKNWAGPSYPASITPSELKDLIQGRVSLQEGYISYILCLREALAEVTLGVTRGTPGSRGLLQQGHPQTTLSFYL